MAASKNPISDLLNSSKLKNGGYGTLPSSGSTGTGYAAPDSVVGNSAYGGQFGASNPSTITLGGQKSDPAFDIYNDPAFSLLRNSLSAAGIADASKLRGLIQQALIQFGSVPNLPQDVLQNSGLDTGETQALAAGNPFSTLKQLQQGYEDKQLASKNQLAARGILNSGETGYQLGRLGQQQAQTQYDATSQLLSGIGGFNDQYVQGRQAAANQLAQGALTAENTAAQNGGGGGGTTTATWDPATGLYKDANGRFYDPSGNPATPSTSAPPSNSAGGGYAPAPTAAPQYVPGTLLRPGLAYAD